MKGISNPLVLTCIAAILVGLLNLFSKHLMELGFSPLQVSMCREGITALVFGLFLLFRDRSAFKINLKDVWIFILFGFFNVLSNLCMFEAQNLVPLEVAAVLEMTNPYFILIFAYLMFGDPITKRKILACVIVFIGCIFITGLADGGSDVSVLGLALGLMSGITLALFCLASKFTEKRNYSENTSMFYFFFFSALMLIPVSDIYDIGEYIVSDWTFVPMILTLSILCTLVPNYIVIYAVRRADAAIIMIIINSSIIVSTAIGVLVFGDPFTIFDLIGIILVMVAIIMLNPPPSRKKKQEEAV